MSVTNGVPKNDLDKAIAAARDWNSRRGQISGSLASERKYDAEGAKLLRKLTAALDAAQAPPAAEVPEGYALVPVEPTEAMLDEGGEWTDAYAVWSAMLAAAERKGGES